MWLLFRRSATNVTDALSWLRENTGVSAALSKALSGVLREMWVKAWDMGREAADGLTGRHGGDVSSALQQLMQQGASWVRQIVSGLMQKLAEILAKGGTLASLESAISSLLSDAKHAYMIALTEITRASSLAAMAVYRLMGVAMVDWVTAHDARVCGVCNRNQAASPLPLGVAFPSGAYAPPQHPNCRCALVPA